MNTGDGASAAPQTGVVKRSVVISGHKTSVSLEAAFWESLKRIALEENRSLAAIIARIDESRGAANLSSALRVFVLERALERADAGARVVVTTENRE